MTSRLEQAFQKASVLSESEQDALAALILAYLEDDPRWSEAFSSSQDLLAHLTAEARGEYRSGGLAG